MRSSGSGRISGPPSRSGRAMDWPTPMSTGVLASIVTGRSVVSGHPGSVPRLGSMARCASPSVLTTQPLELKTAVIEHLQGLGYDVRDLGTNNPEVSVDYPDYGAAVGRAVATGTAELGVALCGTGHRHLDRCQQDRRRAGGGDPRRHDGSPWRASTTTPTSCAWAPGCSALPPPSTPSTRILPPPRSRDAISRDCPSSPHSTTQPACPLRPRRPEPPMTAQPPSATGSAAIPRSPACSATS